MRPTCSRNEMRLGLEGSDRNAGHCSPGHRCSRTLGGVDICVQPDPPTAFNRHLTMNKLMEYMALGKACIAYDMPETRFSGADAIHYVSGPALRTSLLRSSRSPTIRSAARSSVAAPGCASRTPWPGSIRRTRCYGCTASSFPTCKPDCQIRQRGATMPFVVERGGFLCSNKLEYNLVDHCNLSCRECSHLSPYVRKNALPSRYSRETCSGCVGCIACSVSGLSAASRS